MLAKIRFGRSGLLVSPVAFGGIPIMRLSKSDAVRVVRECAGMGVNCIDTANAYTDSEEKIGAAIKNINRSELVIASKSGADDKKTFTAHLDNALKALGTDYIDIYQHHNIASAEKRDRIFGPDGAFEGMMDAVKAGKVRFPGFSSHSVPLAIELMKTGKFYTVQLPYNFIDTEAEKEAIPLARSLDMGFFAMKPLGGGMLPNASLAFKFLAAQEGIVPDPGIEKTAEMREILSVVEKAASGGSTLNAEDRAKIETLRKELGGTWCHRCDYCQPCPNGIMISLVLSVESSWKRMPLSRAKGMHGEAVEKARGCLECGDCVKRCPYHLNIPALIKEKLAWWDSTVL